jgi:hypothetical protein
MGLSIKRNKGKKFQMVSTVSDERVHTKEWLSENEAKKELITRAFWKFLEQSLSIDMDFPDSYYVNGKPPKNPGGDFNEWFLKNGFGEGSTELLIRKFHTLLKEVDLGIHIGKNDNKVWEVGFYYHYSGPETLTDATLVRGTKEEALNYLKNTYIPSKPEWMQSQIDLDLDSNSRTCIFMHEKAIIEIDGFEDENK